MSAAPIFFEVFGDYIIQALKKGLALLKS